MEKTCSSCAKGVKDTSEWKITSKFTGLTYCGSVCYYKGEDIRLVSDGTVGTRMYMETSMRYPKKMTSPKKERCCPWWWW